MSCEQVVEIIAKSDNYIRVAPTEITLCDACAPSGRCRADWLSASRNTKKSFEIPIDAPISVEVGDQVTLIIQSRALQGAVLRLYGLPLMGLLIGVMMGDAFALPEGISVLMAAMGTCLGWLVGRQWSNDVVVKVKP